MSLGIFGLSVAGIWAALLAWRVHRAGWLHPWLRPELLTCEDRGEMLKYVNTLPRITPLQKAVNVFEQISETINRGPRPDTLRTVKESWWADHGLYLLRYGPEFEMAQGRATTSAWTTWRADGTIIGKGHATSFGDAKVKVDASLRAYADLSAKVQAVILAAKSRDERTAREAHLARSTSDRAPE